jgi:UDP-N-acetylmuramate-alanine ligase
MRIFRFKTNIIKSDQEKIGKFLSQYKGIRWKINNDTTTKNNVLQVDGYGVTPQEIIKSIKAAGYECQEL